MAETDVTDPDCPRCGGSTHYVRDVDHDYGTCAVYECNVCGHHIHIELPD